MAEHPEDKILKRCLGEEAFERYSNASTSHTDEYILIMLCKIYDQLMENSGYSYVD